MKIPFQGPSEGSVFFVSPFSAWYYYSYSSIGMEVGMVPFNVTPGDLVGKKLLPDFMTFCPAVLVVWVLDSGQLL